MSDWQFDWNIQFLGDTCTGRFRRSRDRRKAVERRMESPSVFPCESLVMRPIYYAMLTQRDQLGTCSQVAYGTIQNRKNETMCSEVLRVLVWAFIKSRKTPLNDRKMLGKRSGKLDRMIPNQFIRQLPNILEAEFRAT